MLADDLTLVDLVHRADEEASAVLQLVDRVGVGRAGLARNDRAVDAHLDIADPRFEAFQPVGHDGFAGRRRQHVRPQADDAARGDAEFQPRAVAVRRHVRQRAFAFGRQFDDRSRILFGAVHGQLLDRFAFFAVDLLDDYAGLAHLQFVTLAAHGFDQHR